MTDFKPERKTFSEDQINRLIRRFGDPHEQAHSMAERFDISDALQSLLAEGERKDKYLRRALHWLDSDLANRYQFPQDIKQWVNSVKVCIDPASTQWGRDHDEQEISNE